MKCSTLQSEVFRNAVYAIALVQIALLSIVAPLLGASWDHSLVLAVTATTALMLASAIMLESRTDMVLFADIVRNSGFIVLFMFSGAALALLATRSPAPVADAWLANLDDMMPINAAEIVGIVNQWPQWSHRMLHRVYEQTGLYLALSLITWHLVGRSDRAWRLFLIWSLSFLVTTMLSFFAPALGVYVYLSAADTSTLPVGAGRYAMEAFHSFRDAEHPLLSAKSIAGVVTFPSFHTVCALILAQAWHGVRYFGPITKLLSAVIIFSCIPMGGHYIVDLIAGGIVWMVVTMVVRTMPRWSFGSVGKREDALIPA